MIDSYFTFSLQDAKLAAILEQEEKVLWLLFIVFFVFFLLPFIIVSKSMIILVAFYSIPAGGSVCS